MFMVEKDEGGFGMVWFTNHGTIFKPDTPWFFTTYLQIETLRWKKPSDCGCSNIKTDTRGT
jgi:hypothetical protein